MDVKRLDLPIKTDKTADRDELAKELDSLVALMKSYNITFQIVWPPNEHWWFWSVIGLAPNDHFKLKLLWGC